VWDREGSGEGRRHTRALRALAMTDAKSVTNGLDALVLDGGDAKKNVIKPRMGACPVKERTRAVGLADGRERSTTKRDPHERVPRLTEKRFQCG